MTPAGSGSPYSKFDDTFWREMLLRLGYPVRPVGLDIDALKDQRTLPSDAIPSKITKLYGDDYIEVALFEFSSDSDLRRSICTKIARSWKSNRLIKPLMLYTNGRDSFAVIVPGKGVGGQVKVLGLSDRLYRTDIEVLESIRYSSDVEELNKRYDTTFFPYEKVRDEFFKGYRDLYQRIDAEIRKELKKESLSYAQRFLGRLMFLYFLQRKGWLKGDKRFIDSIKDYKELNLLFYESLNKEGVPGIPFLNGSLFEREDYMDARMENHLTPKLDPIFEEAREFFDQYNFTVDETSSLELEVSIDPALIGTVFENMLPEYERGSKGTFYTPRSESSFICRRAIANYLGLMDEVAPDGKTFHDGLSSYLSRLRESKSEKEVRDFRERLLSLKILDPAVGSGGFLLVAMQEIIGLIQEAEAIVEWKSDPEEYKKRILKNLYGFDIEAEAIEIARLRLWLSLIIDQKEPEPLPNLDMNLEVINNSLRLPNPQRTLDPEIEELRVRFDDVNSKYLYEHDSKNKKKLREQLSHISSEIAKRTKTDPNVIEVRQPTGADIVIMNPPYVRQEAIDEKEKEYYTAKYGLDKKSDIFAYFLVRALHLVGEEGVVSVISSDKWLETSYGVSLQKKLKDNLIAVYGQRERSFGADINTVITVYSSGKKTSSVHFTYLESYAKDVVRKHLVLEKRDLKPGKWFYLRAPKVFVEKILPFLTHTLSDYAEIKFGIKTGANQFFYMKDVRHLYESDYLSNSKKFEEWGVVAKNMSDLEREGLIYIENEGGQRFVIDRKDVLPAIRSPTEVDSYTIEKLSSLVFNPNSNERPGKYSKQYVIWGQNAIIKIKKGISKGKEVRGYHNLSSTKGHRPYWFNVSNLGPAPLISFKFIGERHFTPIRPDGVLADHTCDLIYPAKGLERKLWIYMNSSLFFLSKELQGLRMGGGALQILTEEFGETPVADISNLNPNHGSVDALKRRPLPLFEELNREDRIEFDLMVLRSLGFEKPEVLVQELRRALLEVVEDRLIKANLVEEGELQGNPIGGDTDSN
ncbi:MAG: class I SAM-dependent DNA methyltransferase [Thaumarchaeota archaeon]|nr:class I SAM-dependent DNA methyltransferase [Nitrososphaerota archaeon]